MVIVRANRPIHLQYRPKTVTVAGACPENGHRYLQNGYRWSAKREVLLLVSTFWFTSYTIVLKPLHINVWAIPVPIVPAPQTAIVIFFCIGAS